MFKNKSSIIVFVLIAIVVFGYNLYRNLEEQKKANAPNKTDVEKSVVQEKEKEKKADEDEKKKNEKSNKLTQEQEKLVGTFQSVVKEQEKNASKSEGNIFVNKGSDSSNNKEYAYLVVDKLRNEDIPNADKELFKQIVPYYFLLRDFVSYTSSYDEIADDQDKLNVAFDTYMKDLMLMVTNKGDIKFGGKFNKFNIVRPANKELLFVVFDFTILANDNNVLDVALVAKVRNENIESLSILFENNKLSDILNEKSDKEAKIMLLNILASGFMSGNTDYFIEENWIMEGTQDKYTNIKELWENNGDSAYFEYKLSK